MAKRFTDSEKWKKPFIRTMKAPYKLLWLYILDECNHAGIWQVDLDVARLKIGERLNYSEAVTSFGNKIIVFDNNEKWFIPDFLDFQYGQLNSENRAHNSVIIILRKYNLIDENNKIKPLISTLQDAMDMDMVKELDKEMDKKGVQGEKIKIPELSEFLLYCQQTIPETYQSLEFSLKAKYQTWVDDGWKDGHGKKISNWKNSILNTIPYLRPVFEQKNQSKSVLKIPNPFLNDKN